MKLGALGEDRLLNQIVLHAPRGRGRKVFAGSADDCAIVEIPRSKKYLVLKTDCVVEGVHFAHGTNASNVGWKAMMRPLSDFAAASAVPQFALITLIVPQQTKVAWVRGLYRGCAERRTVRSEHCRWRNQQHTGANRDFGECDRIC
jgi:Thiamine monophosphate kinase